MAPTEHAVNGYRGGSPPSASSPEEVGAAPTSDKIEDGHDGLAPPGNLFSWIETPGKWHVLLHSHVA